MPRGGRRENAGKKSRWESGRSFAETKVIRVPIEFADQLLNMAHKLDAGELIEIETNSNESTEGVENLREQVERLQERVSQLESRLSDSSLKEKRDRALSALKVGTSAPQYKGATKALNAFIKSLAD
jgi:predicted  nucleic acid-binding Zn-ribbon protein